MRHNPTVTDRQKCFIRMQKNVDLKGFEKQELAYMGREFNYNYYQLFINNKHIIYRCDTCALTN